MGDRAVVKIKGASCAMYLHWNGSEAVALVEKALPRMRCGDSDYSMARLIGSCHNEIDGNCSLGVLPPDSESHGDNGIFVYNCATGIITGEDNDFDSKDIGIPPR